MNTIPGMQLKTFWITVDDDDLGKLTIQTAQILQKMENHEYVIFW